jgi:hypothetical protein
MKQRSILAVLVLALVASAPTPSFSEDAPARQKTPTEAVLEPQANCVLGSDKQECCADTACQGKRLSGRDKHNCKTKSTGKSWHARNSDVCVRL